MNFGAVNVGLGIQSISSYSAASISATAATAVAARRVAAANVPAATLAPVQRDSVSIRSVGSRFFGLSEIGAALEAPARVSNTLATADRALSTLGGLLGNVQKTLGNFNGTPVAESQATVDTQLASIDRVVSSTSFNGRKLLDGSFSATLNGSTLSLPSFSTSSLGNSTSPDSTGSIASLGSEGQNNLSHATTQSSIIVTTAIDQVSAARQQIAAFRTHAVQPLTDAGQSALEHLIVSPSIDNSASASSNAILSRAQGLLQPQTTIESIDPNPLHVLALLR